LTRPATLPAFPPQPAGVAWPAEHWPEAAPADVVSDALKPACDALFDPARSDLTGETRALIVVDRGAVVVERYGADVGPETTLPSWSMAKSLLHGFAGALVRDGTLDAAEPAGALAWAEGDPRRRITVGHLLQMSSGLAFREEYVDGDRSDVIPMLFGEGKGDVAGFAAGLPLAHEPGSVWWYSSGDSNILSAAIGRRLGGEARCRARLRDELLDRIGMRSADPRFDAAGTWIASSFAFATARDFARFGLLYLRGGAWAGEQVVPRSWVDHGRTPAPACATGEYGAHWWIDTDEPGVFHANGYEGQRIFVAPARDVVLVRLGRSRIDQKLALNAALRRVIDAFPLIEA
jgi:CubicO group peptidase (beta-lactamase class C family)